MSRLPAGPVDSTSVGERLFGLSTSPLGFGINEVKLVADSATTLEFEVQHLFGLKTGPINERRCVSAAEHLGSQRDVIFVDQVLRDKIPHDASAAFNEEFAIAAFLELRDQLPGCRGPEGWRF